MCSRGAQVGNGANMPTRRRELTSQPYRTSDRYATEAKAIGQRLRALRKARGLTLEKAAELADMDYQHIQKIEAGKLNVTLVTFVRLAEALGVDLGVFFADRREAEIVKDV